MYNDEHYGKSKASYDGALIPLKDAVKRYQRDEGLKAKYVEAELLRDEKQLSWKQVEKRLKNSQV